MSINSTDTMKYTSNKRESNKYPIEQKKRDSKEYILSDFICTKSENGERK